MREPAISGVAGDGDLAVRRIKALGVRVLPGYPGELVVRPVRSPPPRLLDPTWSLDRQARILALAYREAMHRRFPDLGTCYYGTHRDVRSYRAFGTLAKAAPLLVEREIPPVSWALFSFDTWMLHALPKLRGDRATPPTVAWVYSPRRVVERTAWFLEEAGQYSDGQAYIVREHAWLLAAYRDMWADLLRTRPSTRDEVAVVVEHHFPGDRWERMVEAARRAVASTQRALDDLVEQGVF